MCLQCRAIDTAYETQDLNSSIVTTPREIIEFSHDLFKESETLKALAGLLVQRFGGTVLLGEAERDLFFDSKKEIATQNTPDGDLCVYLTDIVDD